RYDFPTPALLHVGKQVDAILLLVGEDDVSMAVLVEIDKAEAGIVFLVVDDPASFRQGEGETAPAPFRGFPGEHGILLAVADDPFTLPVSVEVAQPNAHIDDPARTFKEVICAEI